MIILIPANQLAVGDCLRSAGVVQTGPSWGTIRAVETNPDGTITLTIGGAGGAAEDKKITHTPDWPVAIAAKDHAPRANNAVEMDSFGGLQVLNPATCTHFAAFAPNAQRMLLLKAKANLRSRADYFMCDATESDTENALIAVVRELDRELTNS